ncbi:MAG: phospholipid scramblase-related protein [Rothia sp. (in: high G+C Gram-positive bacteria)]|nr:phospholipid scramblase-related protein [Rothia sp. (in: high G+C Gram-positive bacteria)]
MSNDAYTPALLRAPQLVVQQTSSFMSNDFIIEDTFGRILARVVTTGGVGARLLKGSRTFEVVDEYGNLLLHIKDPIDFGLDRYELINPDGTLLAHVQKQFSFMKKRISIEMQGLRLQLTGGLFEYNFNITAGSTVAAQVSRQWSGLAAGLRGRSRYGVTFDEAAPEAVRLAMVGGLVALDLIRAKDARN